VTSEAQRLGPAGPAGPGTISDEQFAAMIAQRGGALLALADRLRHCRKPDHLLTRPLLVELLSQATLMEELLDAYGAQNNRRWHPYRSLMAAAKLFANVHYMLQHVRHSMSAYRLLPVGGDMVAATDEALEFSGQVLVQTAGAIVQQAERLGLAVSHVDLRTTLFAEELPPGRLRRDRTSRAAQSAGATVVHLATAFLSQAAESDLLHEHCKRQPTHYAECIPDPINEEELRRLTDKYHNLQSMYDTHVSDTQTESLDADLPVLRGHISVIFHLLEVATALAHYYERHLGPESVDSAEARELGSVPPDGLLRILMGYAVTYASRYMLRAQSLCQSMLTHYAETGRITVGAPRYRGFHVRPSTLLAKIVRHYGSEVQMQLDGERYDAASPMDVFRANEKINARKRRWLLAEIGKLPLTHADGMAENFVATVRHLVLTLAEEGKVVIYERPLQVKQRDDEGDGRTVTERITEEVARLQATGRVDIETEIEVTFVGDKRVLADIELLAESGYGEDNSGNNIPLPAELSYLRR